MKKSVLTIIILLSFFLMSFFVEAASCYPKRVVSAKYTWGCKYILARGGDEATIGCWQYPSCSYTWNKCDKGAPGSVIVDMGDNQIVNAYNNWDIEILEKGTASEGYSVAVAHNPRGPWTGIGSDNDGKGVAHFNIPGADNKNWRYVKVSASTGADIDYVMGRECGAAACSCSWKDKRCGGSPCGEYEMKQKYECTPTGCGDPNSDPKEGDVRCKLKEICCDKVLEICKAGANLDWASRCTDRDKNCCDQKSCIHPKNRDRSCKATSTAHRTKLPKHDSDKITFCTSKGVWRDCDSRKGRCIMCSSIIGNCPDDTCWIDSGERKVGEYPDQNTEQCCGDDLGEKYSGGTDGTWACCDGKDANGNKLGGPECVLNSKCKDRKVVAEICDNNIDDDCDGSVDMDDTDCCVCPDWVKNGCCNAISANLERTCTPPGCDTEQKCEFDVTCFCIPGTTSDCPKQEGVCAGSQQVCTDSFFWPGCYDDDYLAHSPDYENPEVTCDDGLDNDCDGLSDDNDPDCALCSCSWVEKACGRDPCGLHQMKMRYVCDPPDKSICPDHGKTKCQSRCVECGGCIQWENKGCGGGSCAPDQMRQTRICASGSSCITERCVDRCACACTSWTDQGCGAGGCAANKMLQTRSCPSGSTCKSERCVSDPECAALEDECSDGVDNDDDDLVDCEDSDCDQKICAPGKFCIKNACTISGDTCCFNPSADPLRVCANVSLGECCPQPEFAYPEYYSLEEGPQDFEECRDDFYKPVNCAGVDECAYGCCCPLTEMKSRIKCSGEEDLFVLSVESCFYDTSTYCDALKSSQDLIIIILTPEDGLTTNETSIVVNATTNVWAVCSYGDTIEASEHTGNFGSIEKTHESIEINLTPDNYTYYVKCKYINKTGGVSIRLASTNFTILNQSEIEADTTPPGIPIVDDSSDIPGVDPEYTNYSDRLRVSWSSEDNESGIAGYMFWLLEFGTDKLIHNAFVPGDSYLIQNGVIIRNTILIENLNLSNNTRYYFRVSARNNAGLWSNNGSSDGITVDTSIEPVEDTCENRKLGPNETDVDCGGVCDPCGENKKCVSDDDCKSGLICLDGVCVKEKEDKCSNGRLDYGETDVDCGGVCIREGKLCDLGASCEFNSDCESGSCVGKLCAQRLGECVGGQTVDCVVGLCEGTRTCVDGVWGDCVKLDPECGVRKQGLPQWLKLLIWLLILVVLAVAGYFGLRYYQEKKKPPAPPKPRPAIRPRPFVKFEEERRKRIEEERKKRVKALREKLKEKRHGIKEAEREELFKPFEVPGEEKKPVPKKKVVKKKPTKKKPKKMKKKLEEDVFKKLRKETEKIEKDKKR